MAFKPRNLFLFGAGASAGAEGIMPFSPPLGCDLYARVSAQSKLASELAAPYEELFQHGFEAGMNAFAEREDDLLAISAFYREVARYLLQFSGSSKSSYVDIVLNTMHKSSVYATLNYDLLVEDAFEFILKDLRLEYFWDRLQVLKLHGSVNYLVQNLSINNGRFIGFDYLCSGFERVSRQVALQHFKDEGSLMPAMSFYTHDKRNPYEGYMSWAVGEWAKLTEIVDKIIVCGVAINFADAHIWTHLKKNAKKVVYYGIEQDRPHFERFASNSRLAAENFRNTGVTGLVLDIKSEQLTL